MSELYSAKIKRSLFRYSDTETEYFHDINSYLRTGELSDDRTKEELESDIENIDQGFQLPGEYEDSRNNMKVYRGIDRDLGMKINDNVIVKSFISTSTDIEQAFHFTNFNSNCCLFELHLEDNIPYIDMKIYNPHEKEILLPRNLLMTYVGERKQKYDYAGYSIPVYIMKISRPPEITLDVVPSAQGGRRKKTYRKQSRKHNKTRRHGGAKKAVDNPQQVEVSDKNNSIIYMSTTTQKKFRKNRVKTMKRNIIKPPTQKKGVKYLIEPMPTVTNQSSLKGDVIKKYKNGKLVKQVFVSDKKIKGIMKKISDKHKHQGGAKEKSLDKPQQVEVSDKTSFSQSLKSGFGTGLGFGAAMEFIKWIFGSDDDSSDE
jgi:hypothetical protein